MFLLFFEVCAQIEQHFTHGVQNFLSIAEFADDQRYVTLLKYLAFFKFKRILVQYTIEHPLLDVSRNVSDLLEEVELSFVEA